MTPIELPRQLKHGTLTAYNWPYGCRCQPCRDRRAEWGRIHAEERKHPDWKPRTGKGHWYICTDGFGGVYPWHAYENDVCARCTADRATEDYWEERWKGQTS